jgi:hypothetical protein
VSPIQATDPRIRGVLGENLLAHFDVLIDYSRGLLCLDEAVDAVLNAMSRLGGHNFGYSENKSDFSSMLEVP